MAPDRDPAVARASRFWVLLVGLVFSSCVGIPTYREKVTRIIATTWTSDGGLVALGQEVHLGKNAWLMSPEGPGIQDIVDYGDLVLLDEKEAVTRRVPLPESGGGMNDAFAFVSGGNFIVQTSGGNPACLIMTREGALTDCVLPAGYRIEPLRTYSTAGSGEVISKPRTRADESNDVDMLDVRTGQIQTVDDAFLSLPFKQILRLEIAGERSWQCDPGAVRMSPRRDRLAACCAERKDKAIQETLWILTREGKPSPVHTFRPIADQESAWRSTMAYRNQRPRDELVRALRDPRQGAWSPDEQSFYWCNSLHDRGVVIHLDGRPPVENAPCLTLVSWSPDGTRLAGVNGWSLVTWTIGETLPSH